MNFSPFLLLTALGLAFSPAPRCQAQASPLESAAKAAGESAARSEAIRNVEAEAKALKAPTGLLGAKWLMTEEDVRRIRPQAVAEGADTLAEKTEVYGRPALVHYHFKRDTLLLIIVSFPGKSSDEDFLKTQKALEAEYGPAPEISLSKQFRMESKKTIERFVIHHTLQVTLDTPVEQIQFFRTGPKR